MKFKIQKIMIGLGIVGLASLAQAQQDTYVEIFRQVNPAQTVVVTVVENTSGYDGTKRHSVRVESLLTKKQCEALLRDPQARTRSALYNGYQLETFPSFVIATTQGYGNNHLGWADKGVEAVTFLFKENIYPHGRFPVMVSTINHLCYIGTGYGG